MARTAKRNRRKGRPPGSKNKRRSAGERLPGQPYTIREYCHRYDIARATYYRDHQPYLRVIKFGRHVMIPEAEAERHEESRMREPRAQRQPEARP